MWWQTRKRMLQFLRRQREGHSYGSAMQQLSALHLLGFFAFWNTFGVVAYLGVTKWGWLDLSPSINEDGTYKKPFFRPSRKIVVKDEETGVFKSVRNPEFDKWLKAQQDEYDRIERELKEAPIEVPDL